MRHSAIAIVAILASSLSFSQRVTISEPKLEADEIGASEGPSWKPDEQRLYFTGEGRISRVGLSGPAELFRDKANGANGTLIDPEGRLIVCEAATRRVTRTELNGAITVLAESYDGKRFNSPNDLSIDGVGRVYFTDPRYGKRDGMELPESVYRIDGPGMVRRILSIADVERPNGILVSPDGRHLYVADNNNNTEGGARKLWRFTLELDGSVKPKSRLLLFDWKGARGPDGLKMDREGRLFVAAGLNEPHPPFENADDFKAGVFVLSPKGQLLEHIPIPRDEVTNCAFGGADLKTLYITAGGSLYSVRVKTAGRITAKAK